MWNLQNSWKYNENLNNIPLTILRYLLIKLGCYCTFFLLQRFLAQKIKKNFVFKNKLKLMSNFCPPFITFMADG